MELYHVDILNNDLLMVEGTISVDDDANGTAKLTFVSKDGKNMMYRLSFYKYVDNIDFFMIQTCVQSGIIIEISKLTSICI